MNNRNKRDDYIVLSKYKMILFDCFGLTFHWQKGIRNTSGCIVSRHKEKKVSVTLEDYLKFLRKTPNDDVIPCFQEIADGYINQLAKKYKFEFSEEDCLTFMQSIKDWELNNKTLDSLKSLKQKYAKITLVLLIPNLSTELYNLTYDKLKDAFDKVVTADQLNNLQPGDLISNTLQAIETNSPVAKEDILYVTNSNRQGIEEALDSQIDHVWIENYDEYDWVRCINTKQKNIPLSLELPSMKSLVRWPTGWQKFLFNIPETKPFKHKWHYQIKQKEASLTCEWQEKFDGLTTLLPEEKEEIKETVFQNLKPIIRYFVREDLYLNTGSNSLLFVMGIICLVVFLYMYRIASEFFLTQFKDIGVITHIIFLGMSIAIFLVSSTLIKTLSRIFFKRYGFFIFSILISCIYLFLVWNFLGTRSIKIYLAFPYLLIIFMCIIIFSIWKYLPVTNPIHNPNIAIFEKIKRLPEYYIIKLLPVCFLGALIFWPQFRTTVVVSSSLGLIIGMATVATSYLLAYFILIPYLIFVYNKKHELNHQPQAVMTHSLLNILVLIKGRAFVDRDIIDELEVVAHALERTTSEIDRDDSDTFLWYQEQIRRKAHAVRELKKFILLPNLNAQQTLSEKVTFLLLCVSEQNWAALPTPEIPKATSVERRKSFVNRLKFSGRKILIAFLPLILYMGVQSILSVPFSGYIAVLVGSWAIINLLEILDPQYKEKLNSIQNITDRFTPKP